LVDRNLNDLYAKAKKLCGNTMLFKCKTGRRQTNRQGEQEESDKDEDEGIE